MGKQSQRAQVTCPRLHVTQAIFRFLVQASSHGLCFVKIYSSHVVLILKVGKLTLCYMS